jgi:6-phosphogluconolactonase/glucosamine-6-phosphate isomerase/deaminase
MDNTLDFVRLPDREEARALAGESLNKLLSDNKDRPVLLMLSGGSALGLLEFIGKSALANSITVSMLDERFSQDLDINNFSKMQKTDFYQDALLADISFFGTLPRPEDSMESLEKRWELNLKKWRTENPRGVILATIGMGAEGHTAGIFPHPQNPEQFKSLFDGDKWITGYNVIDTHQFSKRLTTTLTFFKFIDSAIGYVCGEEKKEKLDLVLKKQGEPHRLPALGWYDIKSMQLFTDIQQ